MTKVTCHDLLDGLSGYLEGEAPGERCAEIERHLAGCDQCRIVVETLRKTVTLYQHLPRPQMPAPARERLYKCLNLTEYLPR